VGAVISAKRIQAGQLVKIKTLSKYHTGTRTATIHRLSPYTSIPQ
jgi:hypothetical protein